MTLTFLNVGTVVVGSLLGLTVGKRLPQAMVNLIFQGMAALTLYLGIDMLMKSQSPIILILSIVIGGLIGEGVRIDKWMDRLGHGLKKIIPGDNDRFNEGLLTAFMLYCIGTMAFVGPLEEGLTGHSDLLLTKAILDGFSSIILCSRLGVGVLFSILPMFLFQASISLFATSIKDSISKSMLNEMTAAGGILMILLAVVLLELKEIRVINLLPALLVAMFLAYLFQIGI